MANVFFKRGSQANLNTLINSKGDRFVDGAFYLTTDTNRLYVAQSADKLVELNKSITIVDCINSSDSAYAAGKTVLPTTDVAEGQFYYVASKNILCVYKNNQWEQINPDTNTELTPTTTAVSVAKNTAENGGQIQVAVSDTNGHVASGSAEIVGAGTVSVSVVDGKIQVEGSNTNVDTKYEIKTANGTEEGIVKIQLDGNNDLTGDKAAKDSEITFKSANPNLSIAQDAETKTITLTAADQSVKEVTTNFDANGAFQVGVTDHSNATAVLSTAITPTVQYGGAVEDTDGKFKNGTLGLNVYTKTEVDNLFKTADAMTFKGVLVSSGANADNGTYADVPTTKVNAGDTYKVGTDGTFAGQTCKVGDLLIAKADLETSTNDNWILVHTGDDQVVTFTATAADNKKTGSIVISDNSGESAGFTVAAGAHTAVEFTKSGNAVTATVAQAEDYKPQTIEGDGTDKVLEAANATSTEVTFKAITGIETDKYGNVVDGSIKTNTITVKDTHNSIESVETSVTHDATGATIEIAVQDADGNSATGGFGVKSDNLTITSEKAANATTSKDVKINLEWGTF